MKKSDAPVPDEGILVTHLVVAADIATTSHFYAELLSGEVVFESLGAPTFVKLANTWVIVVAGGGTPDKPDVTLGTPPDENRFDAFMNIRVADIRAVYERVVGARCPVHHASHRQRWIRDALLHS